ncbi:MAG: penicillin-binding protein [Patescibacteria group bacterium]
MPIPYFKSRPKDSWRDYRRPRGPKTKGPKKPNALIKKAVLAIVAIGLLTMVVGIIYAAVISRDLPNPNQLIDREIAQSTKIYDRTGEHVLYEISGDQKRTLVALQDIPDYVKQATISIEDKNFYKHGGFSVWAMFRTAITNVIFNRSAGGSTLTQQFVKNAILTPEKLISRKIKELILSYRLEKKFSKDEILQMYLNEIPYGSNAYGVQAAAQKYFGKDIKDVSLAEAAVLAAIVQTPSRYSPYGPNKDVLLSRKDYVLGLMAEQGYISEAERDAAREQEIKFKSPDNNITAPHFVMYIKDILGEKYGEKMIEQDGLKIYTTLDLYKQKAAEEVIAERTKDYQKKYGASNAALVSIDPKNGQILAMVGSRDYFDDSIDGQVNVATRPRQPGSSMKPIVYAALFEKGYSPDTILYDVNTDFSTDPTNPYSPRNYDLKERGPVTIRQALAGSLNIPAVKAIYLAGINNVIDLAENLGYTTLYPRNRFGLSLVLGGGEVKLLEHVNAYSAFARDGQINQIVSILKVEDKNGRIIEEYRPSDKKVMDSKVARMINSVMADNAARSYIFGEKNFLNLGSRPVAAKTGTTNDYHDAWTIGYTPSIVTGVWVGNNNNQAMAGRADGSVVAAPIWHDYMSKILGDTPIETFKAPDDYKTGKPILDGQLLSETVKIDISTGEIASGETPPELINEISAPAIHNILYYVDRDDPLGPPPSDPTQDPQFTLWEKGVKDWAIKNATSSLLVPFLASSTAGAIGNNSPEKENAPTIKINSPLLNQTIAVPSLEVQIEAGSPRGISRTEYYINDNLWETRWGSPKSFFKEINFLGNGYQTLRVRACDDLENCSEAKINFNVLIKNNPISASKNSIRISSPKTGTAAKLTDFPLTVSLQIERPERAAQAVLLARSADGTITTLKSANQPTNKNFDLFWDTAPPPATYTLYAELRDWNGDRLKSNEVKIIIGE